jgi:hypothetical protein
MSQPGNPYLRENISTIDLLIKIAFVVKKCFSILIEADLYWLVKGGQP